MVLGTQSGDRVLFSSPRPFCFADGGLLLTDSRRQRCNVLGMGMALSLKPAYLTLCISQVPLMKTPLVSLGSRTLFQVCHHLLGFCRLLIEMDHRKP
jgi:hypothetical protein